MAVSPHAFPPRKRRPSAASFLSPNLTDQKLLKSLLLLSQQISSDFQPLQTILNKTSSSILRKMKLLAILFQELLRNNNNHANCFPTSSLLCFEELYIVLQRIKILLEDCSNGSKMWLLMQNQQISNVFRELTTDLSTLLDIFPAKELNLSQDVEELVALIRNHCFKQKQGSYIDQDDNNLRVEVLELLDGIKKGIVPEHSKVAAIFHKLNLRDSTTCREEIDSLEDEVRTQTDDKAKVDVISLVGLVRYAKCVLYGASTPRSTTSRRRKHSADVTFPADFQCPISLELMRDPVVVSTGQTYDRASISLWIESGHKTCPKTGQTLAHTELIPNCALRNLIAMWCREQRIPFDLTDRNGKLNGLIRNKAALEATKMTAIFLINKLKASESADAANRVVHELRALAKTDSDSRACIAEAGALPLLVKFLGSEHPNLQVNAVTTILNLSILEANKPRIMETDGVLNGVIEVLRSGATWEAKGNAAATIFSLTGVHAYRKKLGRKTRVVKGLIDLGRHGPTNSKRDALVAVLNLAADRETVGKLVDGGVVEMVSDIMDGLPEEAVTILEVVVKRGGLVAIAASYHMIRKLGTVLRDGTDRVRESAVATLVNMCRKGGSETVAQLAGISGIERVIWEVMGIGTGRARRKAGTLLRILRRWAAGLDGDHATAGYSSTINMLSSTRILLPG